MNASAESITKKYKLGQGENYTTGKTKSNEKYKTATKKITQYIKMAKIKGQDQRDTKTANDILNFEKSVKEVQSRYTKIKKEPLSKKLGYLIKDKYLLH